VLIVRRVADGFQKLTVPGEAAHVLRGAGARSPDTFRIAHARSNGQNLLQPHFMPCGVWEAIYIIEGLLQNRSAIQPDTLHADTQGQSTPVFALAHLLGIQLMPRIRNWHDLILYRPDKEVAY